MTEHISEEIIEPDEAEILAFPEQTAPEDETVKYHSILEVWATILDGAGEYAKNERISPQWAGMMVQSYPEVGFADCRDLHEIYYERTQVLNEILLKVIKDNDGCYKVFSPEEDRETNGPLYKELLLEWQLQIVRWEIQWNCESPSAKTEFACFAEMHKAFFGQTGLTQYLDNIQLEFTEDDSAALTAELAALKAGDRE